MRVLLTGASGMLGMQLIIRLKKLKHSIIPIDFKGLPDIINVDICNTEYIFDVFEKTRPDFVIHTAAQTDVDKCTREPEKAFKINSIGTWNMAAAAAKYNVPIVYISTDYVFDGETSKPYTEYSTPNPINSYGESKLAGEEHIKNICNKYFIIRTSWIYSVYGKNFPLTILNAVNDRKEIKVVSDQIGSPTYANDLADFIMSLLNEKLYGTYHFTNKGFCSWYEFAVKILECAGINDVKIIPISSSDWHSVTKRPKNSVLRHYNLELIEKDNVRHYEDALKEFIKEWTIAKQ